MATRAIDVLHRTTEEYERLADEGFLSPDKRFELIDGIIYEMSPQKGPHATAILLVTEALRSAFPQGHQIRVQLPLILGAAAEPEPDIAVVPGSLRDYPSSHPTTAVLIVEVSDSSSFHDRERKGSLYARAGIPEYWILDVVAKRLEVYRNPGQAGYETRLLLEIGDSVTPLASRGAIVAVADLLP